MTDATPKHRVIQALRTAMRSPNPISAVQLITVGMEELHAIREMPGAEKLETLRVALRDVAAGADGAANTADDTMSPETLTSLLAILDSGLLGEVVDALLNASRGQYAFGKVVAAAKNIPTEAWAHLAVRFAVAIGGVWALAALRR